MSRCVRGEVYRWVQDLAGLKVENRVIILYGVDRVDEIIVWVALWRLGR